MTRWVSVRTVSLVAYAWKYYQKRRKKRNNQPHRPGNGRYISVRLQAPTDEHRLILVLLCHSFTAPICISFARHSSAFSGLFQAS